MSTRRGMRTRVPAGSRARCALPPLLLAAGLRCCTGPAPAADAREERVTLCDRHGAPLGKLFPFGPHARGGVVAEPGTTVRLTIEARKQALVRRLLGSDIGCIVVLQPDSGEVLAMHSWPETESAGIRTNLSFSVLEVLSRTRAGPPCNRCALTPHPPGSLFALVVAAAGLESGALTGRTVLTCSGKESAGGFLDCAGEGHGELAVAAALRQGCGSFLTQLATRLGRDPILDMAGRLGLGRKSGLPLTAETEGLLPMPGGDAKDAAGTAEETRRLAYGLPPAAVTPLQIARLAAALANRGRPVTPRLLLVAGPAAAAAGPLWGTNTHAVLRQCLTTRPAGPEPVDCPLPVARPRIAYFAGRAAVAGSGERQTHTWLVGFAPADRPACAVAAALAGRSVDRHRALFASLLNGLVEQQRWETAMPAWRTEATNAVALRLTLRAGDSTAWRLRHDITVSEGGAPRQQTLDAQGAAWVEREAPGGTGVVAVSVFELEKRGQPVLTETQGFRGTGLAGRFRVSPRGAISPVSNQLQAVALVNLPDRPVRVGEAWNHAVVWRAAHRMSQTRLTGTATYRLAGIGELDGRRLARITFAAALDMPAQTVGLRKLLGVRSNTPVQTGGPPGARVDGLLAGHPAEAAGIRPGDVIVRINRTPIPDWQALIATVAAAPFDEPLDILLERNNEEHTFTVTPRTTERGQVQAQGNLEGELVLDVSAQRLVQVRVDRLAMNGTLITEDNRRRSIALDSSTRLQFAAR